MPYAWPPGAGARKTQREQDRWRRSEREVRRVGEEGEKTTCSCIPGECGLVMLARLLNHRWQVAVANCRDTKTHTCTRTCMHMHKTCAHARAHKHAHTHLHTHIRTHTHTHTRCDKRPQARTTASGREKIVSPPSLSPLPPQMHHRLTMCAVGRPHSPHPAKHAHTESHFISNDQPHPSRRPGGDDSSSRRRGDKISLWTLNTPKVPCASSSK